MVFKAVAARPNYQAECDDQYRFLMSDTESELLIQWAHRLYYGGTVLLMQNANLTHVLCSKQRTARHA